MRPPANNLVRSDDIAEAKRLTWYSDWGNFALIAIAILVASYIVWLTAGWGSTQTVEYVQEGAFLPLGVIGAILAFRAARFHENDRQTRLGWSLIGAAILCWLAGDLAWAVDVILGDGFSIISLTSLTFVAAVLFILAGVLSFPSLGVYGQNRRVFLLDSAIILVGFIASVAFFVIGPDRLRFSIGTPEDFTLFIYSTLTVASLYVLYHTIVRRPAANLGAPIILMSVGLTVVAVSNLVWTYSEVRGETQAGGLEYLIWMVGQAIFVASSQLHYDLSRRGWSLPRLNTIIDRSHTYVPYLAAVVGMIVLMSTGGYIFLERLGVVIVLVLTLIGLIIARQIVSLRLNARYQAQQAIRETEDWFRALVRYSSDMITVIDREFRCGYQSPSAPEVSRHLPVSPVGTRFLDWVDQADRDRVEQALESLLQSDCTSKTVKIEWQLMSEDGAPIQFETIVSNRLDDPTVKGLVLNSRDVSERKVLEDQLIYQAYHDPLTDLPNRARFFRDLEQSIQRRSMGKDVALLFIDVDDFKRINDQYGHDIGDEFLQAFAFRVRNSLRPEDALYRLAGDEFTVILRDVTSVEDARSAASRILTRLQEPFNLFGIEATITTSIGIALDDGEHRNASDLVRQADVAMYEAKRQGIGLSVTYGQVAEES